MTDVGRAIVMVFVMLVVSFFAYYDGMGKGVKDEQHRAISAGVGEYVANPATGKVEFVYKTSRTE